MLNKVDAMEEFQNAAELLKAVGHPERLRILMALRGGEQCVCHLTTLLGHRQPYVSQQLSYLREAGLISDRKDGLRVYYRICDPRVSALLNAIDEVIGRKEAEREARASSRALESCPCPQCTSDQVREEAHLGGPNRRAEPRRVTEARNARRASA